MGLFSDRSFIGTGKDPTAYRQGGNNFAADGTLGVTGAGQALKFLASNRTAAALLTPAEAAAPLSTTGQLALPRKFNASARNSGNSGDVSVLDVDMTTPEIIIGQNTGAANNLGVTILTGANGQIRALIGGSQAWAITFLFGAFITVSAPQEYGARSVWNGAADVMIGASGLTPAYSEKLRVSQSYAASATTKVAFYTTLNITGGAGAGLFCADECDINITGATDLTGAVVSGRNAYLAHYSTAAGADIFTGDYIQIGAGDFTGGVTVAVGSLPTAWASTRQVAFGTALSAIIHDGSCYVALGPFGASATNVINEQKGYYAANQGATGVVDAIGYKVDRQTGASAKNTGIENSGTYCEPPQSPAAIGADQNDYDTVNAPWLRISASIALVQITGFATGQDGRVLTITNVSAANAFRLLNDNAGSAAGNRMLLSGGADQTLLAGQSITLRWDRTTNRWRQITLVT